VDGSAGERRGYLCSSCSTRCTASLLGASVGDASGTSNELLPLEAVDSPTGRLIETAHTNLGKAEFARAAAKGACVQLGKGRVVGKSRAELH
jgi:hypothetical protein